MASKTSRVPSDVMTTLYPQQYPTAPSFSILRSVLRRLIHSPTGLDCMCTAPGNRENHSVFFLFALHPRVSSAHCPIARMVYL